jgi:hypothetical protein
LLFIQWNIIFEDHEDGTEPVQEILRNAGRSSQPFRAIPPPGSYYILFYARLCGKPGDHFFTGKISLQIQ